MSLNMFQPGNFVENGLNANRLLPCWNYMVSASSRIPSGALTTNVLITTMQIFIGVEFAQSNI